MNDELLTFRLDQLTGQLNQLSADVKAMHDDVLTLKVKSALWGAASGAVLSAIVAILAALVQRMR